jgi:hypothetical protein
MAKIFPEHLSETILSDPKRKAEIRTYDALATMESKFLVFYSVAWQARRDGIARDGEADFVIVHPDWGIIILEVKGGGVEYHTDTGEWFTVDRDGIQHKIHDPVEQAKKSHYTLFDKLCDLPGWDRNRYVNIGHAVCFPNIHVPASSLKWDLPRQIIIDHEDIQDIEKAVLRIFEYYVSSSRKQPLGLDRTRMVQDLLASSFAFRTPLGVELEEEDEKIIQLTEQQMLVLQILRKRRRAAIAGCAGSGKTMLALNKARLLSDQGFRVLLVCFNVALAQYLRNCTPSSVAVYHFHGLCKEMAQEKGFSLRRPANEQEYNDVILPEELLDAAEQLGPQFDAIIVDEGQDFKETYWIALGALLEPDGIFYVFYDDNQNLYSGADVLKGVIDDDPFILPENCRNTKAIHNFVVEFHNQPDELFCRAPFGRPPELSFYKNEGSLFRMVQAKVHHLVVDEHIAPQDIVILTPRGQERTIFKIGTRLGSFMLTDGNRKWENDIQVSTVHSFKGLERRIVILVEVDDAIRYKPEAILYVGCSRARTHLILFADEMISSDIRQRITSACKG